MKRFVLLLILVILAITGVLFFANKQMEQYSQSTTPTPSENDSHGSAPTLTRMPTPTGQPEASGTVDQVKIFLIAIDDQGKAGEKIGCGDSVVPITKSISPTKAPLTQALKELLSIKTRDYGQSGLYDALYQSNLRIESVTIQNNAATVKLSGSLTLGGECDNPRVEAQLRQTILQFPTVRNAVIYINNKPLRDVLSEK